MREIKLTIDGTGLEFDRSYGCENKTGWHVVVGGSFYEQFIPLAEAIERLKQEVDDEAKIVPIIQAAKALESLA